MMIQKNIAMMKIVILMIMILNIAIVIVILIAKNMNKQKLCYKHKKDKYQINNIIMILI